MGTPIGEEKEKKTARISYLGSWKSHLSPLSSHLSIAIAFFFFTGSRPYAFFEFLCATRNCDSGSDE